jgi:MFS superfamily sulfate permease-like transporter
MEISLKDFRANLSRTFGSDLLASIVVFLVALPLCMGIAIASGVPPVLGLLTGVIGGIVVGALAGSPLQVSGPAAGLTVLVYEIVQEHGLALLGVIVLLAGLMQIMAGILKLGQWFRAVSPAVVQGMLAGIGVLIIASQIHVMVDDGPKGSGLNNILSIPAAIWKGIVPLDGSSHHMAAAIGLLTIGVMIGWSFVPKRLKQIPAPLVAVLVATAADTLLQLPIKNVSVTSNLLSDVHWLSLGSLSRALEWPILGAGLAIAVIASAETLLSATAVDRMHKGPRTQYNRELFAQGVGNTICGLLGTLPLTGVIVRSSANVAAGAKTRLSAMLHGVWILAFVSLLPSVLNLIPTTSLAAILVYTGFKLVTPKAIRQLSEFGKAEVAIYLATIIAIVTTNLLEGVLIGLGLALLKLLYTFSHLAVHLRDDGVSNEVEGKRMTLDLVGSATFLRLPALAGALESVPPNAELHVRFDHLQYIDHACLDLLMSWEDQHQSTGGCLVIEWDTLHQKYHERQTARASQMLTEQEPLAMSKGA